MLWAKYTTDGSSGHTVLYRYGVSGINDKDEETGELISPTSWVKSILNIGLSKEKPYLWMKSMSVAADKINTVTDSDFDAIEPILLSAWGIDGNAPNYNITLYKYSNGYSRPYQPSLGKFNSETGKYEFADLKTFRENNPDWLDVPSLEMIEEEEIDVANTVEINTVEELNENLIDGKTIKLAADLNIPSPIIITEGDVTIDLNGHNITAGTFMESNGEVLEGHTDSYVFWVKGGHLTIKGNGVVKAVDADYSMAVWSNGGDVTIKDGRFENGRESCSLIYASARKNAENERIGGTVTIYGGDFYATLIGEQAGTGDKRTALNTKNSDEDICHIVVYGGYFHEFDPSNNNAIVEDGKKSFLADNVIVVPNDNGVFEVINDLDIEIWWQCTVLIDGINNEVLKIGSVERYTAIDGTARPGQYTINLYAWSTNQSQPEMSDELINGWRPANYNYLPDKPFDENGVIFPEYTTAEASLWMITANISKLDENGIPVVNGAWSEPVKLTGPRGPISYNYRIENRYMNGLADAPRKLPSEIEWETDPKSNNIRLTSDWPYLWVKPYLVYYKMEYDYDAEPNEDGMYPTKPINERPDGVVKSYSHYRLTGLNGQDGGTKNNLTYTVEPSKFTINSFSSSNLYVSNSAGETEYSIEYNILDFISGYTGKFANIGSGTVRITTVSPYVFVNGSVETTSFTLAPNESVEVVCYLREGATEEETVRQLLVIGKTLEQIA